MKIRKFFEKRSNWGNFPQSQKFFSEIGGKSETGGKMHHCLRGMDAPGSVGHSNVGLLGLGGVLWQVIARKFKADNSLQTICLGQLKYILFKTFNASLTTIHLHSNNKYKIYWIVKFGILLRNRRTIPIETQPRTVAYVRTLNANTDWTIRIYAFFYVCVLATSCGPGLETDRISVSVTVTAPKL